MRGTLHLTLTDHRGHVVAGRRSRNTVLRAGGRLVADLFTGGAGPVTHMGVGTSDADPTSVTVTALANDDGEGGAGLAGPTTAPIPAEAFSTTVDEQTRRVLVRARATLPDDAAVGTVREAGLIARTDDGDVLYNRVTFAPLDKGDDHEMTLFWEVEFPYGDLSWLVR